MQTSRYCLLILLLLVSPSLIFAQGSSARQVATEEEKADLRIDNIIQKAETHFRNGKIELQNNRREQARDQFDKAVDVILEAGLDIRSYPRLREYYVQLTERIYREEVPVQSMNSPQPHTVLREQKFDPSPLDELSRSLTADERRKIRRPTCSVNEAGKIEIRSLRLGMTLQQVKDRLPGLKVTLRDKYGKSEANIIFRQTNPSLLKADFKGVSYASFEFMDGRLTKLAIIYDDSIKWNDSDEFVSRISEALNLSGNWQPYKSEESYKLGKLKSLDCSEYSIVAGLTLINYKQVPIIYLWDIHASELWIQRWQAELNQKKQIEEERRKTFKP